MKITNNAIGYVMRFFRETGEKHLPQKVSYALARNIMILGKNNELYISSMKQLFEKYSEYIQKDDDGNDIIMDGGIPEVDDSHKAEFLSEVEELANIEIEVELYKIDADCLNYDNDKYDTLTVSEILDLERLICNPE